MIFTADTNTQNVRSEATFLERANRVWGVNEYTKPIRDHNAVKGTEIENDANNIHALVRTNAVILFNLHKCTLNKEYAFDFLAVLSEDRVQPQIRNFSNFNRISFAALGNFFIENILKDLVSELGGNPNSKFYSLTEQAVDLAKLNNPEEKKNGLQVVSKIRNTFHNRGIHTGYKGTNEKITVEGVTYMFNHNDIVKGNASWDYICHGYACALKTVYELIEIARRGNEI